MPNERIIPSAEPKTVTTFTILSDGNEVSREYHILSITINKEVNRIPTATIILIDGSASAETFEISNKPDFEPGKPIEINAGYRSDEQLIFAGIVIKHSIKVRKNNSLLIIECKDEAVKMTASCKSKYYHEVTDSDVIEELLGNYNLSTDVASTSVSHKQLVQYNCTDWDFMLCRCDANGLLCIANDNEINVAPPDFGGDASLTIQYGATILDLDAEIDARLQYSSVKGVSWSYTDQALLDSVEGEDPGTPPAGNLANSDLAGVIAEENFTLFHGAKIEEPELQAWVNSKLMRNNLAKIRGKVRVEGTADVAPGQLIEINGIGERFEGKLYVTGVRHEVEDGSWQTVFQFGIDPEWFSQTFEVQQPSAGGLLPGIEGLQTGIVTQLQDDPDGEDRILVRIPIIHAEDEGIWCRLSSLDAGENRGMVFRPEIEDEVVVGFINNDPRHGIVLGMLNSSAKPSAIEASDDNHEKGYVSRGEMKIIFNDDVNSITIETPGGNKVQLSEEDEHILLEDQHGNTITMNSDGITINSASDLNLTASGDINLEGTNLSLTGSSEAKMEGSSGAEISSSGTTNVKGSLVNIN